MNIRTRNVQLKANRSIEDMTQSECIETLERSLCLYRWLAFPDGNPSHAINVKSKKELNIRNGTRLAIAVNLKALAHRLEKEANE